MVVLAIWVLDASHGGNDTGIIGNTLGRKESDLVLEAVLEAKKHLERNGETVVLTRESDIDLSSEERMEIAKKSNGKFFVSFHMNSHINKNVRGVEVFYGDESGEGERLAKLIRDEMLSDIRTEDRGVYKEADEDLNILPFTTIFIYGEYLSNPEVEKYFDSRSYGRIVAKACLAMIDKVLLLTPVREPKKTQKMTWRVCIGYYKDYNKAIDVMVDMHKKGYKRAHVVPYNGK